VVPEKVQRCLVRFRVTVSVSAAPLHPTICRSRRCNLHLCADDDNIVASSARKMVLQDLGRRINAAVSDLTRSSNLDEKVKRYLPDDNVQN
jgi:hypothetical protein